MGKVPKGLAQPYTLRPAHYEASKAPDPKFLSPAISLVSPIEPVRPTHKSCNPDALEAIDSKNPRP